MQWKEVQDRFPNEWVVFEATKAHSREGQRYIEEMAVIDSFDDSTQALSIKTIHWIASGRSKTGILN